MLPSTSHPHQDSYSTTGGVKRQLQDDAPLLFESKKHAARILNVNKYRHSAMGILLSDWDRMHDNPKCHLAKRFQRRIGISFQVFNRLLTKVKQEGLLNPMDLNYVPVTPAQKDSLKTRLFDDLDDDSDTSNGKQQTVDNKQSPSCHDGYWDELLSVDSDASMDNDEEDDEAEYPLIPIEIKLMVSVRMICKGASCSMISEFSGMSRKCARRCHDTFLAHFPLDAFLEWVKNTRKLFYAPRKPRNKKT